MRKFLAIFGLLTLVCSTPAFSEEHIRIVTFNIAEFGAGSESDRSIVGLVNIIRKSKADLLCLQEVEPSPLGKEQVKRLVCWLNKAAKHDNTKSYSYVISEKSGDEATAFLWRDPVKLESELVELEHNPDFYNDGIRTFQRVPTYALFSAGTYTFYVVNCHLYTKIKGSSSVGRGEEYDELVGWLKDLATEEEKDAIVVGDFNRFLSGKSVWKRIYTDNHTDHYRFPLLEAIKNDVSTFDPKKHDAPLDKYSTTAGKTKRIYDQVLISKGSYDEFSTTTPKFGEDVGIIDFDNDNHYVWATSSWHDSKKTISDHRPVWIRMKID